MPTNPLPATVERLRLATSAASLGVWEWDVGRDEIWVTEPIRKRVGARDSEQLNFEKMLQTVHPDDRESIGKAVRAAIEDCGEFQAEYRSINSQGELRWNAARGQVERGDNGKAVRMRGVSADITERHNREEALRESEGRFRHAADAAPVMIWMSGTDKLCHYFNRGWLNYTGRSLELELGNGWSEGVHPEDFARCLEMYTKSFDARREFAMEYRLRKRDGNYGWVLDTGVPRFAEDGRFLGYIGSCIDISMQQEAGERIRESADFSAKIIASLPGQIAILDRSGTILGVNDAWRSFALENGSEPFQVGVGVGYLEVCERAAATGDETARRVWEGIRSVLEGASSFFEIEYPCNSPTEERSFLMRVVPLRTSGGGAVVSHTDISELKRAEQRAEELRRDLAHVQRVSTAGQLSATLAHELNQPLGIILSNAQAAEELLKQSPPDVTELKEIVADIIAADRRASEVIQRMRALLKRGEMTRQPLLLNDVVREVLGLLRADLIGRGVTINSDLSPDSPLAIGDRVQLQQVVLNLILNAADAMSTNRPGTRRLFLSTARHQDQVRVSVRDEGVGLPVNYDRLFQPYFTTKPHGLGMGLSICRSIIDAHGGRLWAEPHGERGAVFHLEVLVTGSQEKV